MLDGSPKSEAAAVMEAPECMETDAGENDINKRVFCTPRVLGLRRRRDRGRHHAAFLRPFVNSHSHDRHAMKLMTQFMNADEHKTASERQGSSILRPSGVRIENVALHMNSPSSPCVDMMDTGTNTFDKVCVLVCGEEDTTDEACCDTTSTRFRFNPSSSSRSSSNLSRSRRNHGSSRCGYYYVSPTSVHAAISFMKTHLAQHFSTRRLVPRDKNDDNDNDNDDVDVALILRPARHDKSTIHLDQLVDAWTLLGAYFVYHWKKEAREVVPRLMREARKQGLLVRSTSSRRWERAMQKMLIERLRGWEKRLRSIGNKNHAIEAVKIGTYYSEDKEEVNAYVRSQFEELRRTTEPNLDENELTKKYTLKELLEAKHGEEVNIFDPFDEAESESEDTTFAYEAETKVEDGADDEVDEEPCRKKARRDDIRSGYAFPDTEVENKENATAVGPVSNEKHVIGAVGNSELNEETKEMLQSALTLAKEQSDKLPPAIEVCATRKLIFLAIRMCEDIEWESLPSEILEQCFTAIKPLYLPGAQMDLSRSLKRRLNAAINQLAMHRHAHTEEGQMSAKCGEAVDRVLATLSGQFEGSDARFGDICSWIQEKLKVGPSAAQLCVRKLMESGRVSKIKRRFSFPEPLVATASECSAEDRAMVEQMAQKNAEKRKDRKRKRAQGKKQKQKKSRGKKSGGTKKTVQEK